MCGHKANPNVDIFVSSARKKEVEQYAAAVQLTEEECVAEIAKIRPALNVKAGGGHKHTYGPYVEDASKKIWKKIVPIPFDIFEPFN